MPRATTFKVTRKILPLKLSWDNDLKNRKKIEEYVERKYSDYFDDDIDCEMVHDPEFISWYNHTGYKVRYIDLDERADDYDYDEGDSAHMVVLRICKINGKPKLVKKTIRLRQQ